MVVKNIVNIQNNKIDFDINGTNSLRYSFRGTEHFRLTEVNGSNHVQFIAQKALTDNLFQNNQITEATNADFIGRISNIDNHSITNLKDVDATSASLGQVLVYNGTNWKNQPPTAVGATTLTVGADSGTPDTIDLLTETFKIIGTASEIETITEASSTAIKIGLPNSIIITDKITVGTNSGGALLDADVDENAIFRNVAASAGLGFIQDNLGTIKIRSNDIQFINASGTIVGRFNNAQNPLDFQITEDLFLRGTNILIGGGANHDLLLVYQNTTAFGYKKNSNTDLFNEAQINLNIGNTSRLELDATNSVFRSDLFIINKDAPTVVVGEGEIEPLNNNPGGRFHCDGTNFYIAYNDGTNAINIETDFAIKLNAAKNTIINAPTGSKVNLGINDSTKMQIEGNDVFIKNGLNLGGLSGSSDLFLMEASGSGATRQFILQDVDSTHDIINYITNDRLRINDSQTIALRIANTNKLVVTTDQVKVDTGANLFVTGDATIDGNLIVNGTQTIINTEIKLIEDPLIELGYAGTNSLPAPQDIGFFGQYKADNYAGLYYDVSATAFKVFDSLGTNDYATSLGTNGNNVTTNARSANIQAKKFITEGGDFGQEIYASDLNFSLGPSSDNPNIIQELQKDDVYGTGNGIFSGKLLSYIYNEDFSITASSLINYNFHVGGTNPSQKLFSSAVELETKIGDINFIDFDSDTSVATITLSSSGAYKFRIRILPVLTWKAP